MVTLPLINSWTCNFVIFLSICDSMPNGPVYCFNHLYNLWVLTYIFLALLNLYLRDPSLERKASFFLKMVLLLPWDLPFTTLGTFWVLTNWRRCWGTKVHICPRRTTKFEEIFLWANRNFISIRGCIFSLATPLWSLFKT